MAARKKNIHAPVADTRVPRRSDARPACASVPIPFLRRNSTIGGRARRPRRREDYSLFRRERRGFLGIFTWGNRSVRGGIGAGDGGTREPSRPGRQTCAINLLHCADLACSRIRYSCFFMDTCLTSSLISFGGNTNTENYLQCNLAGLFILLVKLF